jgi:hypothetical protein
LGLEPNKVVREFEVRVSERAKRYLIAKGYLAWPSRADPLALSKALSKWLADKAEEEFRGET